MKQIFDFMRRRVIENTNTGRWGVGVFMDTINEAEAKWETECCEWKQSPTELWTFDSSCGSYLEVQNSDDVRDFKFCPFCGKPIKISEVE